MASRGKVIRFPGAAAPPPPPEPEPSALVPVARCRGQAEALVVRSLLDSEGIPTAIRSNLAQSVHPFSVGQQGASVVLVPASDLLRARTVLSRRGARYRKPT
jgi:hypothetical protein